MKGSTQYFLIILIFGLVLFVSPAARAGVTAKTTWSFEFDSGNYSRVLDEIIQKTGVNIDIPRLPDRTIGKKTYNNKTLGYIISDLFQGFNHAVLYYYRENTLDSVKVVLFGLQGNDRNREMENTGTKGHGASNVSVKKDSRRSLSSEVSLQAAEVKSGGGRTRSDNPAENMDKIDPNHDLSLTDASNDKTGNYIFIGMPGRSGSTGGGPETTPVSPPVNPGPTTKPTEKPKAGSPVSTPPYSPPPKPVEIPGLEPPPMPPGLN